MWMQFCICGQTQCKVKGEYNLLAFLLLIDPSMPYTFLDDIRHPGSHSANILWAFSAELPPQPARPQPGLAQGISPSQRQDLAFALAEFCVVPIPFLAGKALSTCTTAATSDKEMSSSMAQSYRSTVLRKTGTPVHPSQSPKNPLIDPGSSSSYHS